MSSKIEETSQRNLCFSAVVVTFNEERRLQDCLGSLQFCDQLIVIDLGSRDQCVSIAQAFGAEVMHHPWVPIVEQVWPFAVSLARNPWIIRADPDEVFPPALITDVTEAICQYGSAAMLRIPHQYYFRGEKVRTGFWGGTKLVFKIFHKDRIELRPNVHRSIWPQEGFVSIEIPGAEDNLIQHYWADSFAQLFSKHWRYLKHEGESRYQSGQRFSWKVWLKTVLITLHNDLFALQGIRGGFSGLFLSLFYTSYIAAGLLALGLYQRRAG